MYYSSSIYDLLRIFRHQMQQMILVYDSMYLHCDSSYSGDQISPPPPLLLFRYCCTTAIVLFLTTISPSPPLTPNNNNVTTKTHAQRQKKWHPSSGPMNRVGPGRNPTLTLTLTLPWEAREARREHGGNGRWTRTANQKKRCAAVTRETLALCVSQLSYCCTDRRVWVCILSFNLHG